jgi:hypothetical protein
VTRGVEVLVESLLATKRSIAVVAFKDGAGGVVGMHLTSVYLMGMDLSWLRCVIQASIEKVLHLGSSLHSVRLLNNISLGSFGAVEVMGEDCLVQVE